MAVTIFVPKLAVSMTEGTIADWLVEDGSKVSEGQPIYRLETDKADSDIEAPASGTIRIEADPGETLEVGTPIGEIE